ncbi:MAG: outer membrane lipoprotein-sorting protein [Spirochaetales bacterium]|nr:outer membrane lipoprotein-sorting protein [Spirochaetales bacterium]
MKAIILAAGLALLGAGVLSALTAEEILRAMETNRVHETESAEGSMIITDRFGSRAKTFRLYAEGADKVLIEFTNPEERGQRIMRLEDEIYLYFPDAEEVIRLQGSALKESVMGSDFSYEDMTGERELIDLYRPRLVDTMSEGGRRLYVLELEARERGVAYPRQTIWVEVERLVLARAEYFSLSGRLLKSLEVLEVADVAGKSVPVRLIMRDEMKKSSSTEFAVSNLRINEPLPKGIFSLESLSW